MPDAKLNPGQAAAVDGFLAWFADPASAGQFALINGPAGTGKTFCLQQILMSVKGKVVFTAPTNKAVKVIADVLRQPDYIPLCCTTYSLLGLRLEANGEVRELTKPEKDVDLSGVRLVVVDEGSMVNATLLEYLSAAVAMHRCRVLVLADGYQLPPVGEAKSAVLDIHPAWALTEVMRHDNQILTLATAVRQVIGSPFAPLRLADDNAGGEGVWFRPAEFTSRIRDAASRGAFSEPGRAKAIAWRNVTVDLLNQLIRQQIYHSEPSLPEWVEGDRIIFTGPAIDPADPDAGLIATTDDEGRVARATLAPHPIEPDLQCWRLQVTLDSNRQITAWVLPAQGASQVKYQRRLGELSDAAKLDRRKWKAFWAFKELFHSARYGYAITAHRSQGSTYEAVFVDTFDILLNKNRAEALRCLYVACSRPKKVLVMGKSSAR